MTTLTNILNEIADAFFKDKRHDGTEFVRLKDERADWLKQDDAEGCSLMLRIHAAVDDRGPDDWVYETAWHMANRLAESCEYHTRKWEEADGHEWDSSDAVCTAAEPDIYTMDRLKWLASNLSNSVLVDEVAEESGTVGIVDQIAEGQAEAMRRIGEALINEAQQELAKRQGSEH